MMVLFTRVESLNHRGSATGVSREHSSRPNRVPPFGVAQGEVAFSSAIPKGIGRRREGPEPAPNFALNLVVDGNPTPIVRCRGKFGSVLRSHLRLDGCALFAKLRTAKKPPKPF